MQLNSGLHYLLFDDGRVDSSLLIGISSDGRIQSRDHIFSLRDLYAASRAFLFESSGILHAAQIPSRNSVVIWKIERDRVTFVAAYKIHRDGSISDNWHDHPTHGPRIIADIDRFIYANSCNCICLLFCLDNIACYIYIDTTTWDAKVMNVQFRPSSMNGYIDASFYDRKKDIHYFVVPTGSGVHHEEPIATRAIVCPTSRIHEVTLGLGVCDSSLAICGDLVALKCTNGKCGGVYSMDSKTRLSQHVSGYFYGSLWLSDSVHVGLFCNIRNEYSLVYSQHVDGTTYAVNVGDIVINCRPAAFFCDRSAPRGSNRHWLVNASLHSRARL